MEVRVMEPSNRAMMFLVFWFFGFLVSGVWFFGFWLVG